MYLFESIFISLQASRAKHIKQLVSIKSRSHRGRKLQAREDGTMRGLNQGEPFDHFVI